jgi:hypothetical protein
LLCFQWYTLYAEAKAVGYFGNFFHMPLLPAAWVPSEALYFTLLAVGLAGALLAVAGCLGRAGLLVASLIGLYLLLCDRLQYHNNRFALYLLAFLAAFTPSDRSFLLCRLLRGKHHALDEASRIGPTWARHLLQFQVSAIYVASSTGKLFDADWRSGIALAPRFQRSAALLAEPDSLAPAWLAELVASPAYAEVLSKAAITTELFLAFALWFPRTRAVALWLGVGFHLGIELGARVELFSWVMGAAYLAFVTPELRERELCVDRTSAAGRVVARATVALDWLARFRVSESRAGEAFSVTERGGAVRTGAGAVAALSRAIPVLFLVWPLLEAVALLRRRRSSGA